MNLISIKRADISHLQQLNEFQLLMAKETENLDLDPEILRQGIKSLFDDPSKGSYWVAIHRPTDEVVGCFLTISEWSDWRNGEVLWIHSVYVKKEFRQQKVFSTFYTFLKEMVMNHQKYKGLRLYVDKTNLTAQKVYQQLGMSGDHYQLYEWLK